MWPRRLTAAFGAAHTAGISIFCSPPGPDRREGLADPIDEETSAIKGKGLRNYHGHKKGAMRAGQGVAKPVSPPPHDIGAAALWLRQFPVQ